MTEIEKFALLKPMVKLNEVTVIDKAANTVIKDDGTSTTYYRITIAREAEGVAKAFSVSEETYKVAKLFNSYIPRVITVEYKDKKDGKLKEFFQLLLSKA